MRGMTRKDIIKYFGTQSRGGSPVWRCSADHPEWEFVGVPDGGAVPSGTCYQGRLRASKPADRLPSQHDPKKSVLGVHSSRRVCRPFGAGLFIPVVLAVVSIASSLHFFCPKTDSQRVKDRSELTQA